MVHRFGEDFELDRGAYQLRRAGHALKLERIPMEILLLLVEQRGQLVSRDQIVERIWGKGHYLDTDNSINRAIHKIRDALRDDSEQPRFIQTVSGHGYRFVAPVVPVPEESRPRQRRRVWLSVAVALPLVLAAVVWVRARPAPPPDGKVMVAVLPFQNLTGDAAQEYLSDGLTEEMITQLGNRDPEHLGVIARTSVMQYKRNQPPLDQMGRDLGVQFVLAGSVRRDTNQVRIAAQLIQVKDQKQIWARQFDRELKGLLTLQGEIAREIANEIQATLGNPKSDASALPAPSAHEYASYDLYLKGQYFLNKRTVADLERAIGYFRQAIVKDSTYARAHAALADAYVLLVGYSGRPPQELMKQAQAAVLKALELDPGLAEAHTALALIVQNGWDWQTAEREFRRAIELNPNYATAHHWYAEHLMWRGRFEEALLESERARQLDPLSLIIAADNGAILYFARQYDRAIEKFRSVLELDPDFPRAHFIENAYAEKGMISAALADVEAHRAEMEDFWYWVALVHIYGRTGQIPQARHALDELLRASRRRPVQSEVLASSFAAVGDKEQALAWLDRAYTEHNGLTSLKVHPVYDSLRSDPRFQNLLRRVGLQ